MQYYDGNSVAFGDYVVDTFTSDFSTIEVAVIDGVVCINIYDAIKRLTSITKLKKTTVSDLISALVKAIS